MKKEQLKREQIRNLQERVRERRAALTPDYTMEDSDLPPRLQKAQQEIRRLREQYSQLRDKQCEQINGYAAQVRNAILFKPLEEAVAAVEAFEKWTPVVKITKSK